MIAVYTSGLCRCTRFKTYAARCECEALPWALEVDPTFAGWQLEYGGRLRMLIYHGGPSLPIWS
jgi:hypothetical protein